MKERNGRASALSAIAASFSKLNDSARAKQLLSQALNLAKSIKDESSQADVLRAIAEAYRKLDDIPTAQTILTQATQSAEKSQNSSALSDVAQVYAELGNWGEAEGFAQRCNGDDKVAVLARILRVHAEQQQPEFKALRELEAKAKEDN